MLFAASGMSTFSDVMFGIMFVFGYLGSPIMADLGLGTMADATKTANDTGNPVPDYSRWP